ncbi:hypothetical protein R1flu_007210 [Riccia fluitans]|uniref:Uncharacterized protein n=1 Tax=Riccia fluitans TaxID=41844 RepID=A0ABD1YY70_9MARC
MNAMWVTLNKTCFTVDEFLVGNSRNFPHLLSLISEVDVSVPTLDTPRRQRRPMHMALSVLAEMRISGSDSGPFGRLIDLKWQFPFGSSASQEHQAALSFAYSSRLSLFVRCFGVFAGHGLRWDTLSG